MSAASDTRGPGEGAGGVPTWSVMIPTYEPTAQLREALESIRAAWPHGASVQLEVVDDASPTVDVKALLRSWGFEGVGVHRRAVNGGLGACWNECIERARGALIHILHQDDLVKPQFYDRMGSLAARFPSAGMYFCRTEFLDERGARLDQLEQPEEGIVDGWLDKIAAGQRLQCPSVVVRRETYQRVGRFEPSLRYVIDWELWVRIATVSEVAYTPASLVTYRIHVSAETSKVKAAGIVTLDFAAALQFIHASLENARRSDCFASAQRFALDVSTAAAREAELARDPRAAMREVGSSLRHLSAAMPLRSRLRRIRWYLQLLLKARKRTRFAS